MVNQAKLRSYKTAPHYKYGFEVPRTFEQALRLDKRNGNTLWEDDATLELTQIDDYDTFIDKGHHTKVKAPIGYKKIRVHLNLMSNMMEDTKQGWLLMAISLIYHWNRCIQE
jgi:hypothetical protein